uniref:Vacuolar ATPase assembly integral membrane protein VMA21 homolog n=1 Tax=Rhodosorus marinus TaxID=101924 RepID=A0A7S0G3C3_9RHOD
MDGVRAIVGEKSNRHVLEKFVKFSIALIVLPVATFFGVLQGVDGEYGRHALSRLGLAENKHGAMTIGALSAVLVVNIILVMFVVMALKEDSAMTAQREREESESSVHPTETTTVAASTATIPLGAKEDTSKAVDELEPIDAEKEPKKTK